MCVWVQRNNVVRRSTSLHKYQKMANLLATLRKRPPSVPLLLVFLLLFLFASMEYIIHRTLIISHR